MILDLEEKSRLQSRAYTFGAELRFTEDRVHVMKQSDLSLLFILAPDGVQVCPTTIRARETMDNYYTLLGFVMEIISLLEKI